MLPSNVPALPADYEETEAVQDLGALLVQPKSDPKYRYRVGFFGMGGLGVSGLLSNCAIFLNVHLK